MVTAFSANNAEASDENYGMSSSGYWYEYNGHTGYNLDGAFILDQPFLNGLGDNNFTLNGYWVNAHPDANTEHSETLSVYDQTLYVNTDGEVYRADFPINNPATNPYATLTTIENTYGEPAESTVEDGDGKYYYFVGDAQITFTFEDGLVNFVEVGAQ